MISKLEALADALAFYHRAFDPESDAYKARNPGLLRATQMKHKRDENGKRVFDSYLDGYQALLFDLKIKCSGKSAARHPLFTLSDLVQNKAAGKYLARFLTKALNETITAETSLSYFIGD